MITYPEEFRYTTDHEWVRLDGEIATVGITDHAQQELGEIVYLDPPKLGARVEQGRMFCSVESVKAANDVFSPVSGEVVEVNEPLVNEPKELNQDPHGSAWLARIRLSAPQELDRLMTAAEYSTYVGVAT